MHDGLVKRLPGRFRLDVRRHADAELQPQFHGSLGLSLLRDLKRVAHKSGRLRCELSLDRPQSVPSIRKPRECEYPFGIGLRSLEWQWPPEARPIVRGAEQCHARIGDDDSAVIQYNASENLRRLFS